jgi:hypothetical protein
MKLHEMDLYKYHSNPETLPGYEKRHLIVPELAYKTLKLRKKLSSEDKQLALRAIAKSPNVAYYYATDVIKRRFPEGEVVISKHPYYAYNYAATVIKGRWPEGEAAISKDPEWACYYAENVIKGRFPEGEAAIAKSPNMAYYYATNVIEGRFPQGEAAIAMDPHFAKKYKSFLKDLPKDEILEMDLCKFHSIRILHKCYKYSNKLQNY